VSGLAVLSKVPPQNGQGRTLEWRPCPLFFGRSYLGVYLTGQGPGHEIGPCPFWGFQKMLMGLKICVDGGGGAASGAHGEDDGGGAGDGIAAGEDARP